MVKKAKILSKQFVNDPLRDRKATDNRVIHLVLFKILKKETFSCLENVALVKLDLVIYQCPKAQHVTF